MNRCLLRFMSLQRIHDLCYEIAARQIDRMAFNVYIRNKLVWEIRNVMEVGTTVRRCQNADQSDLFMQATNDFFMPI